MAVAITKIDLPNKRIYFDVDAGDETTRTVQEMGSLIKQEFQRAPLADDDLPFTWTGFEDLDGTNRVGIVMTLLDDWEVWTEDQGSPHVFKITKGIIISSGAARQFGTPTNITWVVPEYTVSSILPGTISASGGGSGGEGSLNVQSSC
jgi:hypothetical protein